MFTLISISTFIKMSIYEYSYMIVTLNGHINFHMNILMNFHVHVHMNIYIKIHMTIQMKNEEKHSLFYKTLSGAFLHSNYLICVLFCICVYGLFWLKFSQ